MRGNLGGDIACLCLGSREIGTELGKRGLGGAEGSGDRPQLGDFLSEISQAAAVVSDALGGGRLFGGRLGLRDHALPVGQSFDDLGVLGLMLGELLRGGLTGFLQLGQSGFSGRDLGFDGLRGGLGGGKRRLEFGQTLLDRGQAVDDLGRIARNLGDLATGRGLEETHLTEPVTGNKGLGIVEADDAGNLVVLLDALSMLEALTVDAPHRRGAVGAARNQSAVRQEGDGLDIAAMGTPSGDLLAGLHLPGGDNAIGRTAGEDVGVGTPGEVGDTTLMLPEVIEFAAVVGFPDKDVAVAVGGGEQDAVRAEIGAGHPLGVLGDQVELLARGDVEALHLLGIGGEDDLAMVGRDVGRHHLVELLADLGDTLAGLNVPDDSMTNLAAATAAHDEQGAVGAELQRASIAFRIRQNAGEFVRIGVVEEDLLLAGDGEERSPRARRHRGDGGRALGHDDGLEQDVFRTGHRAGGLARSAGESKIDLGSVGFLGDAPLSLQHSARDPLGK